MTERPFQQVNLLQAGFRREKQLFSIASLLAILGVFVVSLAAIYSWGYWQVAGLEGEVVLLEGRERAQAAQLASLDPSSGTRRRAEIEAELARLSDKLAEQQRLIEVLEDRPLGAVSGFGDFLAALGRSRTDGLWLTRIEIDGAARGIALSGRSIAPELVPAFLLGLGEEEALAGLRFDRFRIERDDDESVTFGVASRAIDGDAGVGRAR